MRALNPCYLTASILLDTFKVDWDKAHCGRWSTRARLQSLSNDARVQVSRSSSYTRLSYLERHHRFLVAEKIQRNNYWLSTEKWMNPSLKTWLFQICSNTARLYVNVKPCCCCCCSFIILYKISSLLYKYKPFFPHQCFLHFYNVRNRNVLAPPYPSHPIYRQRNSQMRSSSESPRRPIKKTGHSRRNGQRQFPKKYWMSWGIQPPPVWKYIFARGRR